MLWKWKCILQFGVYTKIWFSHYYCFHSLHVMNFWAIACGKNYSNIPKKNRGIWSGINTDGYVWTLSVFFLMLEEKSVQYPAFPNLYFSLVVTDNSSTTREASLFWETSFIICYMEHESQQTLYQCLKIYWK